jgi:hypothetical protein
MLSKTQYFAQPNIVALSPSKKSSLWKRYQARHSRKTPDNHAAARQQNVQRIPAANAKSSTMSFPSNHRRFKHRELVDEVRSEGDEFSVVRQLRINPGDPTTFPWFSGIARNYEFWKMHSLRVEFETAVGTTTAGNIYMAPEYDVSDVPPATALEISAQDGAVIGSLYSGLHVDMKPNLAHANAAFKFVRQSNGYIADATEFDGGFIYVAISGYTGMAGRLYVSYEFELKGPGNASSTSGPVIAPRAFTAITTTQSTPMLSANGTNGQLAELSLVGSDTNFARLVNNTSGELYAPNKLVEVQPGRYNLTWNSESNITNSEASTRTFTYLTGIAANTLQSIGQFNNNPTQFWEMALDQVKQVLATSSNRFFELITCPVTFNTVMYLSPLIFWRSNLNPAANGNYVIDDIITTEFGTLIGNPYLGSSFSIVPR